MAFQIFHHHVPENHIYDPSNSGAEWWVQIRPSPSKTGRYSLIHAMDQLEKNTQSAKLKSQSLFASFSCCEILYKFEV